MIECLVIVNKKTNTHTHKPRNLLIAQKYFLVFSVCDNFYLYIAFAIDPGNHSAEKVEISGRWIKGGKASEGLWGGGRMSERACSCASHNPQVRVCRTGKIGVGFLIHMQRAVSPVHSAQSLHPGESMKLLLFTLLPAPPGYFCLFQYTGRQENEGKKTSQFIGMFYLNFNFFWKRNIPEIYFVLTDNINLTVFPYPCDVVDSLETFFYPPLPKISCLKFWNQVPI